MAKVTLAGTQNFPDNIQCLSMEKGGTAKKWYTETAVKTFVLYIYVCILELS